MLDKHYLITFGEYSLKTSYFMAAFATTFLATAAHATTTNGVYVSAGGLADLTQTQHNRISGSSSQVGHAPGWGGDAAIGYGFGNGFRAEIEGLYLQTHVNRVSPLNAHGHSQAYGGLLNILYDIDLKEHFGLDVPVTPYVGVGAGYLVNNYNVHGPVRNITGTQGSFGYQGIVGAAFDTGVPGLQATVDYRMIGQTMSGDSYHDGDSHFDHRFNHTFNVGLRYAFNPAPAAPVSSPVVAAPAPTPARTYLVFFDWDKSSLTSSAKSVVASAAQATTHVAVTKIEVNGYTDNTSVHGGQRGAEFNERLSVRRAEAVESELVKLGVPKDSITIKGYGQTHQLVPTGPNTREVQNRRVEIILK